MYKPSKPYKQKIIDEIKKTWKTPYVKVKFNTYPIVTKHFSYPEVDHTDGIGTKGYYHWVRGTFREAVIDALAMNLNDLAIVRAVPYKLSNHITVPLEDIRVYKIIKELVRECRMRKIAIVGGENSFHDNIEGLDISMTVSGFIKNPKPNRFEAGDVLIGLRSSGLHSNGITTVRKVFGREILPEFTKPTSIYIDKILELGKRFDIHGMMHITGGAYTKLKDIAEGLDVAIFRHGLKPQRIFYKLHEKGISDKKMYETFNCGVGFIFSVTKNQAEHAAKTSGGTIIGGVRKGNGKVIVESFFSRKTIVF